MSECRYLDQVWACEVVSTDQSRRNVVIGVGPPNPGHVEENVDATHQRQVLALRHTVVLYPTPASVVQVSPRPALVSVVQVSLHLALVPVVPPVSLVSVFASIRYRVDRMPIVMPFPDSLSTSACTGAP